MDSDLFDMISELIRATENAADHGRRAHESAVAASLIAEKIAKHPQVESLDEDSREKLMESSQVATRLNQAFGEIYGRPN